MTEAQTIADPSVRTPVPMTEEQKFVFDLKGWLAVPGVLDETETNEIRTYLLSNKDKVFQHPDRLDPRDRVGLLGPAEELVDHPVVLGILDEVIGRHGSEAAYGYRCENSFIMYREYEGDGLNPHAGTHHPGLLKYDARNGRIFGGLIRVVWEINEVRPGDGGTLFMSGTHKMNFPIPEEHKVKGSPLFEDYSCPPGSVVLFSESVCHAGPMWRNPNHPRLSIFNCYTPYQAQAHKLNLPHDIIMSMPPKRRTLFRGAWGHDFMGQRTNDYYSEDNRAL